MIEKEFLLLTTEEEKQIAADKQNKLITEACV